MEPQEQCVRDTLLPFQGLLQVNPPMNLMTNTAYKYGLNTTIFYLRMSCECGHTVGVAGKKISDSEQMLTP